MSDFENIAADTTNTKYYTDMDVRRAINVLEHQYSSFTTITWSVVVPEKQRSVNTTKYDTNIRGIQMYSEDDEVEITVHKKFNKLSDLKECIDAMRVLSKTFGPMIIFNQYDRYRIVSVYGRTEYVPGSNSSVMTIVIEIEPIVKEEEEG